MAEITLDDNKICIPTRLKIATFLSELQKKTKQIIYLINDKEIGIFQSLNDVKRGMWRRLKPNDTIAHYYIDPETQNEYTIFSPECANKLGNFPYEGPISQLSAQDRSAYQQSIQTTRPQIRNQTPSSSLQQPIQSLQQPIQSLQQPMIQNVQSYSQNQFANVGYQKYPPEQRLQQTPSDQQQKMNSKSIQNMNRIAAFQKQQMAPPEPTTNQWFNNFDMNHQELYSKNGYPSTPQFQNQPQQTNYPTTQQFQNPTPQTNYSVTQQFQNQPQQTNYSVTQQFQNQPQQTNYPVTQQFQNPQSVVNPSYGVNRQVSTVNQSAIGSNSQMISDMDLKDPMKYFPPGTRKKLLNESRLPTGQEKIPTARQQTRNVTPQILESKFSA
jgi:hypothetical protein